MPLIIDAWNLIRNEMSAISDDGPDALGAGAGGREAHQARVDATRSTRNRVTHERFLREAGA